MYEPKTEPFEHQRAEWEFSRELPARAIFWEMGTGKSKLIADTAGHLFTEGKIDALVVVAPDGVHRNWVVEELPKHLPDDILARTKMHCFQTSKKKTKWHVGEVRKTLVAPGFAVMAFSFDSVMTEEGKKALWLMLRDRRCLYVVDESARIKTPGAKRTKRILSSAPYAPFRRVLNGTPIPNSPFDIYSQLKFVDPEYWSREGITTFQGFKHTFGIWVQKQLANGRSYPELAEYQDMNRLKLLVDGISSRVTKDQVLDLPPKLYSKARFQLSPAQERLYTALSDDFMAVLSSGELITASLAIVRLLRLQQVCCGYLPSDDEGGPLEPIGKVNPRLELFSEIVADLPHKAIVWARFRQDIDNIMERLGKEAVRYDGRVDDEGRADAIERFQRGDAKFFVANAQAAGTGLTLTAARTVIYYSNSFNLMDRLQSEDRAHRIGQEHPVNYIDLVADNTVDWHIVGSLRSKMDIASTVTGDKLKEWL